MYDHLAQAYTRLLRQASPQAAKCIEKIELQYGTQAAVRAAFSLVLTMRYVRRVGQMPATDMLMWGDSCVAEDHPGAQHLYERAHQALLADLSAQH